MAKALRTGAASAYPITRSHCAAVRGTVMNIACIQGRYTVASVIAAEAATANSRAGLLR